MFYLGFPFIPQIQFQNQQTFSQQVCYPPPEVWYEYCKQINSMAQKTQTTEIGIGTDSVQKPQARILQYPKIQEFQSEEHEIKQQDNKVNKKRRKQSEKKNTETNIINQLFCFLFSQEKSGTKLKMLTAGCQRKYQIFYASMKNLKAVKSKYLNKKCMINLIFLSQESIQRKIIQKNKRRVQELSLDELKTILVRLSIYFLKSQSVFCLLNSKRIKGTTLFHHLNKRRQLINKILAQVSKKKEQFQSFKGP